LAKDVRKSKHETTKTSKKIEHNLQSDDDNDDDDEEYEDYEKRPRLIQKEWTSKESTRLPIKNKDGRLQIPKMLDQDMDENENDDIISVGEEMTSKSELNSMEFSKKSDRKGMVSKEIKEKDRQGETVLANVDTLETSNETESNLDPKAQIIKDKKRISEIASLLSQDPEKHVSQNFY